MRVDVNGVRLFVDIAGAGLVPDGTMKREKPTPLALDGVPGADPSLLKPALSQLSDLCQILYVDHRGNGRSDDGDVSTWTLAQWGHDGQGLCHMPGIEHGRFDVRAALCDLTCPALTLADDRDPIMPRVFFDGIAHHMPHTQHHVLENADHLLEHDAPDVFSLPSASS